MTKFHNLEQISQLRPILQFGPNFTIQLIFKDPLKILLVLEANIVTPCSSAKKLKLILEVPALLIISLRAVGEITSLALDVIPHLELGCDMIEFISHHTIIICIMQD